jgi:type IV pilus assembly protein PilE
MRLWVVLTMSLKDYYKNSVKGFHLIEILIVLTIFAILVALGQPFYSRYFVHEKRLEAAGSLAKLALALEQYHIEHDTYQDATLTILNFPAVVAKNTYRLKIQLITDNDYLLEAQALGQQAKNDHLCRVLTLKSNGEKGVIGSGSVEQCWK